MIIGDAHQNDATCREVAVACIDRVNTDTQVCIIIAVIGRFKESAGNEQIVIAVIVKGNVERVKVWDGKLITRRAQKEGN